MIYIANYGGITGAQATALNSFIALADTPAGQHLAKVAGVFANTPDTGGGSAAGGLNTQLQWNNAGALDGITRATTDGTTVSFLANGILIKDQTDATKIGAFDASGISTATTCTFTLPNLSGTLVLTTGAQTIESKTFNATNIYEARDDRFTLQSAIKTSKQAMFDLSAISLATTRTFTLPDTSDTVAVLAASQAFTNKSYNGLTLTTTTGTFTLANGKTLTASNTLTFTGTDGSTVAFGAGGTVLYTGSTIPLTVGTTTIASGTTTRVLYDNAGVLGEYSISGTGNVAMTTSPTFVTPTLGAALATSVNGLTLTTSTGTFTLTNAKTFAVTNSLTLSGTDSTVMTFPTTSKTIAANDGSNWTIASQAIGDLLTASSTTAYTRIAAVAAGQVLISNGTGAAPIYSANPSVTTLELGAGSTDTTLSRSAAGVLAVEGVVVPTISSTNTLTNKRITERVGTTASSATPTPDADANDVYTVTALAAGATFGAPTGTPTDGQKLTIRIKDNGTARTLAFNAIYRFSTDLVAPTTTVISKTMYLGFVYNSADSKWDNVAQLNNF